MFHEVSDKQKEHFTSPPSSPDHSLKAEDQDLGGYNLLILHFLHQSVLWSNGMTFYRYQPVRVHQRCTRTDCDKETRVRLTAVPFFFLLIVYSTLYYK